MNVAVLVALCLSLVGVARGQYFMAHGTNGMPNPMYRPDGHQPAAAVRTAEPPPPHQVGPPISISFPRHISLSF